jgi:hypothetical protein
MPSALAPAHPVAQPGHMRQVVVAMPGVVQGHQVEPLDPRLRMVEPAAPLCRGQGREQRHPAGVEGIKQVQ